MIVNIPRNLVKYSDNQKTNQKNDIIAILKRFDLVTKQVFLLLVSKAQFK